MTKLLMNTCAGWNKVAGIKAIILWLTVLSISVACTSDDVTTLSDVPIVVSQPEQHEIDIDLVISNAQDEVQKILPDAYLAFFSFVGECGDLPNLQGKVRLDFAQVQRSLFGDRTFLARVTVETVNQTLSLNVKDETEHYPNLEPLVIDGKGIQEIASILNVYLDSTNRCKDIVVLTRVRTESPWRARCGPPDEVLIECLEIDPTTGDITELR